MLPTIRVLVVDDSALIRQMLTRALAMDPRVEVVGTAKDGVEAIQKAGELNPDVITLDIEMPELTGLEALSHIRKKCRARVVMLSSLDDPDTTYQALTRGAVDFMSKPSSGVASSLTELADGLLKTIKTAYRIAPERAAYVAETAASEIAGPVHEPSVSRAGTATKIAACIGIAASTGGPPVLEQLFAGLAANLPAAYVIVQHLPPGFGESLARRLSAVCDIHVKIGQHGEVLEPGHGYIAPHGHHMTVEQLSGLATIRLTDDPPLHGVRPAGDPLLQSVARTFGKRSVAVVLTGMGSDGADGALAIKGAGGDVILQDEHSSIVWGMPGTAMRKGASNRAVALPLLAAEIRRAVRARGGD